MPDVSNPHDRFFKEIFSRREVAVDFLRNYLSAEVLNCLDEETLRISKDSFIDKELAVSSSDLLYEVNLKDGSDAYVYLLFEHKSFPEPLIAFHLLRYMVKIWEQDLKTRKGTLSHEFPPIIPLVLYHGASRWNVARQFSLFFRCPEELKSFLPDFRYALYDMSSYSHDEIKGMVLLKVTLLLFRYIFHKELRDRLPEILCLLSELKGKHSGLEYLETVLTYLSSGTDKVDEDDIRQAVEKAFLPIGGEIMPTLAEKWMEQGFQQGIQQGVQQGILQRARENVAEVLEIRFGTVTKTVLKKLKEIDDPDLLRILFRKAMGAESFDEFKKDIDVVLE